MNREEKCIDQKSLSISDLQIDDLNLDNSVRNNEIANFAQLRCSNCGVSYPTETLFKKKRKDKVHKKSPFNPSNSNNKCNERNGRKPNTCFICGLEDHFIENCPKSYTPDKKVHWNTEKPKSLAYRLTKIDKTSENSKYESESQKIYASMAHICITIYKVLDDILETACN